MTGKSIELTAELHDYLLTVSLREDALLAQLREETSTLEMARMQIAPEQGQFMQLLVKLIGAKKAIEVGVFTGYSALCVAQAMGEGGHLIACDIDEVTTATARRYWQQAGVADRIELRLDQALNTLAGLIEQQHQNTFDFAFIDADKSNYQHYYEAIYTLLRPGGLMVIDNVLWSGRVLDATTDDEDTRAIDAFNRQLRDDERVDISLLPLADGLTLIRKK